MTVERRYVVGLADIRSFTFECTHCSGRLSLKPGPVNPDMLAQCPMCSAPWLGEGMAQGRYPTDPVMAMLKSLFPSIESQSDPTSCVRILFEFDEPVAS